MAKSDEIAEKELKPMAELNAAPPEKETGQKKPVSPAEARSGGIFIVVMGIIWLIIAFVANWAVFSFNITKWVYGLVGAFWGIIFISCILAGFYFILRGFWSIITGKE
jgi:hypothetical protein